MAAEPRCGFQRCDGVPGKTGFCNNHKHECMFDCQNRVETKWTFCDQAKDHVKKKKALRELPDVEKAGEDVQKLSEAAQAAVVAKFKADMSEPEHAGADAVAKAVASIHSVARLARADTALFGDVMGLWGDKDHTIIFRKAVDAFEHFGLNPEPEASSEQQEGPVPATADNIITDLNSIETAQRVLSNTGTAIFRLQHVVYQLARSSNKQQFFQTPPQPKAEDMPKGFRLQPEDELLRMVEADALQLCAAGVSPLGTPEAESERNDPTEGGLADGSDLDNDPPLGDTAGKPTITGLVATLKAIRDSFPNDLSSTYLDTKQLGNVTRTFSQMSGTVKNSKADPASEGRAESPSAAADGEMPIVGSPETPPSSDPDKHQTAASNSTASRTREALLTPDRPTHPEATKTPSRRSKTAPIYGISGYKGNPRTTAPMSDATLEAVTRSAIFVSQAKEVTIGAPAGSYDSLNVSAEMEECTEEGSPDAQLLQNVEQNTQDLISDEHRQELEELLDKRKDLYRALAEIHRDLVTMEVALHSEISERKLQAITEPCVNIIAVLNGLLFQDARNDPTLIVAMNKSLRKSKKKSTVYKGNTDLVCTADIHRVRVVLGLIELKVDVNGGSLAQLITELAACNLLSHFGPRWGNCFQDLPCVDELGLPSRGAVMNPVLFAVGECLGKQGDRQKVRVRQFANSYLGLDLVCKHMHQDALAVHTTHQKDGPRNRLVVAVRRPTSDRPTNTNRRHGRGGSSGGDSDADGRRGGGRRGGGRRGGGDSHVGGGRGGGSRGGGDRRSGNSGGGGGDGGGDGGNPPNTSFAAMLPTDTTPAAVLTRSSVVAHQLRRALQKGVRDTDGDEETVTEAELQETAARVMKWGLECHKLKLHGGAAPRRALAAVNAGQNFQNV